MTKAGSSSFPYCKTKMCMQTNVYQCWFDVAKSPLQGVQEVRPKAPRKRRYMPKILSEKPKRSRAKKPRKGEAAPDEASPPILVLETSSPSLLQVKMLARHKKPQIKRRRYVKRQKRSDEATNTMLSKDPPAAHTMSSHEELENAPTIEELACQLNDTDGQHSGSSQCTEPPLFLGLNPGMVEKSSTPDMGRQHLYAGREGDCNAPEFSKILQEPLTMDCEAFSLQVPLADKGSSNLVPVPEPNRGTSLGSEVLVEACLRIPGNVMSIEELRNALDPVSSWPDGPPDLNSVDRICAADEAEFVAVDEEHPSTPGGPGTSGNSCQDYTLVMPPSPPSPPRASDRNGGFSRISAVSTRRTLNFGAQVDELQRAEFELVLKDPRERKIGPAGLVKAMAGGIAESEESPQSTVCITRLEIQVAESDNCVPAVPWIEQAVPLAVDARERREGELQIVAYDDGSKKMVVYKKPPVRKRRVRFKPKVDLDFSTVRKFKALMLKGSDEDASEQDKASWEQSRLHWQNRAHQFISIMRQVQGYHDSVFRCHVNPDLYA